jgi:hypothetical protein
MVQQRFVTIRLRAWSGDGICAERAPTESIEDDSEIDLGELQSSTMWKVRVAFDPRAYIYGLQHPF